MPSLILPSNRLTYKRVLGANPGAGVELSDTVPAGKMWWLLAYYVQLVQGITQTPQPILVIDDGTNVIWEGVGSSAAQIASSTCSYTWAPDFQLTAQIGATPNTRSNAPMSGELILPPGYRIKSVTLGIGANSDYGPPSIYVCECDLSVP